MVRSAVSAFQDVMNMQTSRLCFATKHASMAVPLKDFGPDV